MELTEFDRLVSDKRHKEIVAALKSVAAEIQRMNDNSVKDAMQKQLGVLEGIVKVISVPAEKPDTPIVNVANNNDEVVSTLKELISHINQPESKITEWNCSVIRNRAGTIDSINIKGK